MNNRLRQAFSVLALSTILVSCSVTRKNDLDGDARAFISNFSKSLSGGDEMFAYFDARQSRETITTIISILRDRSHEFIACEANFSSCSFFQGTDAIRVTIPVTFRSRNLEREYQEKSQLTFLLKPDADDFSIFRIEGDDFYKGFSKIKNEMEWLVEKELEIKKRAPFYAIARAIQQNFDSVIWYTEYKDEAYFYVVNGTWENYFRDYRDKGNNINHRMGVVNQDGRIVIPAEYDLVGTPGFSLPNIVEVRRGERSGYFDISLGREVIPTEYESIIPYGEDNVLCFVRRDTVWGYYDNAYDFSEGFLSDKHETWVKGFHFLPTRLQLDAGYQSLCEIPSIEHAGFGIVIPPSYLVRTGVFPEIIGGISPTDFAIQGWTDYVEAERSVFTGITETLSVLVTTIKERYIDGREEFYRHDKVAFIGPELDTLAVSNIGSAGEVSFRVLDSLVEVRHYSTDEANFEESYGPDIVPRYFYFQKTDDLKIRPLRSTRMFAQTEFILLDSTYFTGTFKHFTKRQEDGVDVYGYEDVPFISKQTIQFMRDEILASYGFKFENEELNGWFYQYREIPARTRDEIERVLTERDRQNIAFLETLLEAPNGDAI